MKKVLNIVCCLLLLTACSKDNDETVTVDAPKGVATVTFHVTPNGLGDNGYNDNAAQGIFAFANQTGTRLRMLQPKDARPTRPCGASGKDNSRTNNPI